MKIIINLLINIQILVLFIYTSISAQSYSVNELAKYPKSSVNHFERLENIPNKSRTSVNLFPNNTGDFWEYIEEDTTTLFSQFLNLKFSISREVLADTLMSNGLTYKKVKWQNEANSVNFSPIYEHLRVDSTGNAYIFYNTSDYILFDFTLDINQTYSAHLFDYYWKVLDKYNVIGFGDTLQATDFGLYILTNDTIVVYTLVENFGIIGYYTYVNEITLPRADFWGAVISGQDYGTLIVKKQAVDWKEFYPLHIGDYWVYEGISGSIPITNTVRVIGDTIMPDNNFYFVLKEIDHTFGYTSFSYRRIDRLGRVFYWETWNNNSKQYFEFSRNVGDTLKSKFDSFIYRLNDKYINSYTELFELNNLQYPDISYTRNDYDKGLGLYRITGDLYLSECVGAYVNGEIVWGDTTVTNIEDDINTDLNDYMLFQNYPNPFNPSIKITYNIPQRSNVSLRIYDVLGKEIATLVNEQKEAGTYSIQFDASKLSSGVYIYSIQAGDFLESRKMILMK